MNARDTRALRIGVGVILAAVACLRVVPSGWRAWREMRDGLGERHALLQRAQARIGGMPVLDSVAGVVRARFIGLAPRLVPGGTEAEAQEALGSLVTALADRSRLRVRRAASEGDSTVAGRLHRVSVVLEAEGDWAGATQLFRTMARERTALGLGEVSLQAQDPASPGDRPEVLLVQTVVRGWYLPEELR
jgi:hypothetical protein